MKFKFTTFILVSYLTAYYFCTEYGIMKYLAQRQSWVTNSSVMCRFVAFSRLPANHTGQLTADKGVVFADSLVPNVFFREMKLKLPEGVPTQPVESLHQVSAYLQKIHRLAFCAGTGLCDPIRSVQCCIYVDMPSSVRRCTACGAQRQAVLFAAQQKATWDTEQKWNKTPYLTVKCNLINVYEIGTFLCGSCMRFSTTQPLELYCRLSTWHYYKKLYKLLTVCVCVCIYYTCISEFCSVWYCLNSHMCKVFC
jgi:hypothetical protein